MLVSHETGWFYFRGSFNFSWSNGICSNNILHYMFDYKKEKREAVTCGSEFHMFRKDLFMSKKKVNVTLCNNGGALVQPHGYELDAKNEYVFDLEKESEWQSAIIAACKRMGFPLAIKDYHNWLIKNGFDVVSPNPTNEFVTKYYGEKPLWKTNLSQGIVMRAINDDDYFIVMECSRENPGYKYTKIILTLLGCE